jgi:hypothetical protein
MLRASITSIQTGVRTFKQTARGQFPRGMAVAVLLAHSSERLGDRVSQSRLGWAAMFALPALLFLVDPVSAQVSCNSGVLAFLGSIRTLTVEAIGVLLIVMIASAGVLKMAPWAGTNRLGNQILGGFLVGAGFYVLGPVVVDLADAATPLDMSAQCNAGGQQN